MRGFKSIFSLLPILAFIVISTPSSTDIALAQVKEKSSHDRVMVQEDAPEQGAEPGLTNAREELVIEVVKGTSIERVSFGSGISTVTADDPSADDPGDLYSQIELFKGGDVVVLTVARGAEDMPVTARVDSVKRNRAGPTNLLPFRLRAEEGTPRDGPTNLVPLQPRAAGAPLRNGPTNLIRFQPQAANAALVDAPTRRVPSPSPVTGATLRDGMAGGGVLVASVEQGGPAWRDGLRPADVIAAANRTRIRDIAALATMLASAGPTVVLQVHRSGDEAIVVLHR